jgi:RNA recognition motif-containing protein
MPAEVEEQFAQFGPIKPGGVNVRSQKQGVCYAFVEFENSISAQNAIEASPVSIGGRPAYVEEKRPMGSRGPISLPCYSVLQPNSLYLNHFLLSSINTY